MEKKRIFKKSLNFLYFLKLQKGFSLTELMVVTAVVISLTLFVMVNQRFSQKKFALQISAHQLAQDIRRAQEMAMSGRECLECGGQLPTGYGIQLRTSQGSNMLYKLYADTGEPYEFYSEEDDITIEVIQLEKDIVIKSVSMLVIGEAPTFPTRTCLNFKPPDPLVAIKSVSSQTSRDIAEITLGFKSGPSDTKKITVNKAGLIEIE